MRETFRPWLFATKLDDLAHLGSVLQPQQDEAAISYRVLDGSDGSYRYLLSARDGRVLGSELLDGASRRLNRRISSLSALGDTYYRVGPVEQYLILTDRVFFRGMAYHDLHRLEFDLETTSLDPARGRVFLVAVRNNRGFEQVLEASTPEEEANLINHLCALIRQRDPDTIENHDLVGFDLPYLEHRARVLKVPLYLGRDGAPQRLESSEETGSAGPHRWRRKRFSLAGRELIDSLDAVGRYDFVVRTLPSYRLKEVARHFGLASPERVYLEGARVYETYLHDPDSVRHYALDDVREVDGLSRRLMGAAFALAGMAPRRYERIASAGPAMGILEPLLVRAYLRAGAALPQTASGQEATFGRHQGGATYLLEEGVAEHVVKADVASLYPSLMRAYRIGPSCDHLGVFLHLIDRLTELRLFHKAAARSAQEGSMEADQHEGTQAAMKTMINAAYGYMGATSMALFGDLGAANEVTRRGRALLTEIIEALLAAGRTQWRAGERVRFYRAQQGVPVWLPDEADDTSPIWDDEEADEVEGSEESLFSAPSATPLTNRRDYDSEHYVRVLRDSYAERLRVVFEVEDFSQLFRLDAQRGLFDRPIEQMQLRWIRCIAPKAKK